MALWPLQDSSVAAEGGSLTASSTLDTVVCGAAHTKGAWKQLIASTTMPVSELLIYTYGAVFTAVTDTGALFDIGIGAAAAETVIVSNVQCGFISGNAMLAFRLPVKIASGTRISMRAQCAVASKTIPTQAWVVGGGVVPPESGDQAVTYGALTASSGGTLLATPGAINTKATWTVLSAATTAEARFVMVTVQPIAGTVTGAGQCLIDIGVGAAAAEQVIISNVFVATDALEKVQYLPLTFPVRIKAGSRLVARQQCTVTTATAVPRVTVTTFA